MLREKNGRENLMARERFLPATGIQRLAALLLCFSIICGINAGALAQSGRKVPKQPETPKSEPKPETLPPIEAQPETTRSEPPKPQYTLIVSNDRQNATTSSYLTNLV